jgi:hypothetical protein
VNLNWFLVIGLGLIGCVSQSISTEEADKIMAGESNREGMTGWSQSGKLATANANQKVTMQADFEKGAFGAGAYTVAFDIDQVSSPVKTRFNNRAEAEISWRVEGNAVNRRVSVSNGVQVSGCGQAVRVVISDVTPDRVVVTGAPPAGEPYVVSVQITPGTRPTTETPPVLEVFDKTTGLAFDVATMTQTVVAIPQDAGVVSVYVTCAPTPIAGVPNGTIIPNQGVQVSHGGFGAPLKIYDPRDFDGWVPIATGAFEIDLINNTGFDITFSVQFGIDG